MSRTIRRKGMKYPKGWYSTTEAQFNDWKEYYLSGDWRGVRTHSWTHPYSGKVTTYTYNAKWYHREVSQHETFDAYEAFTEAWFHSDASHPLHRHQVNSGFRRMLNRCFRAKHKNQLDAAIVRGEEEDLVLYPFIKDAAWWY